MALSPSLLAPVPEAGVPGVPAAAVAGPQVPLASRTPLPTRFVIVFVDFPPGLFPWPG